MNVDYRDLDALGFPGSRVGDDGSVWTRCRCKRMGCLGADWRLEDTWHRVATCTSKGYYRVSLRHEDGYARQCEVHNLVLKAFVGPRPKGQVCRHYNGDPTDNRLDNLLWGTQAQNEKDKLWHGTALTSEQRSRGGTTAIRAWNASLTPEQRSEHARKASLSMNPGERSENGRKGALARQKSTTPEQRRASAIKAAAAAAIVRTKKAQERRGRR